MPVRIVRNDITRMAVDAIVTTTNRRMQPGGGVNGAIHRAAGPELAQATALLPKCDPGEARITPGFQLNCRYVIHTVGPRWLGGGRGERAVLRSCYEQSLALALAHGCRSVAFPLIASGAFACPPSQAMQTAMEAIDAFLSAHVPDNDLTVYLVLFTKECLRVGQSLFRDVQQFIDDHYVEAQPPRFCAAQRLGNGPYAGEDDDVLELSSAAPDTEDFVRDPLPMPLRPGAPAGEKRATPRPAMPYAEERSAKTTQAAPEPGTAKPWQPASLEEALQYLDEGFAQMLLRKIGEKGMKNADCYKRANIDKKLFSKIISTPGYKPRKPTALALAVALEMPIAETRELLMKAGLALNRSEKFDVIVEFFITQGRYDIFEINEVLFYHDQPLLGGAVA